MTVPRSAISCAVVFFDALADGLAAAAGDVDRFLDRRELVVVPLDFEFEAGAADVVFEREIGEIAVPIQRAGAGLAELDRVRPGREGFAFEHERVVEREQVFGVDLGLFAFLAIDPDFDGEIRLVFAAGLDVIGQALR